MVQADLRAVLPQLDVRQGLSLFVGPEGGFSSAEAEAGSQAGLREVSLRAETAGIVASVLRLYELGCLSPRP